MWRTSLAWIALAACYRPHADRECAIACDFAGAGAQAACPAGMACASPGFCIDEGSATACAPDGGVADDGDGALPFCYGTAPDVACFAAPPSGAVTLAGNIGTDTCDDGARQQVGGVTTCVIAGSAIHVTSNIIAIGSLRLMLVGTQSIMIDAGAGIDLSAMQGGAASTATVCAASVDAAATNGGGAGGSFLGLGGDGAGVGAGNRGPAIAPTFRAGCAGGRSGTTPGGRGGGAIYLVSETQIIVGGAINASGSGGGGGAVGNGGGGGGSGGFIGLDAPIITIGGNARLLAAGGGGGGGGDNAPPAGHVGGAGGDPTIAQPVGAGGTIIGTGTGGAGGSGSTPTTIDGQAGFAADTAGQGGGGGGAAGVIEFFKALTPCVPSACVPARIVF